MAGKLLNDCLICWACLLVKPNKLCINSELLVQLCCDRAIANYIQFHNYIETICETEQDEQKMVILFTWTNYTIICYFYIARIH